MRIFGYAFGERVSSSPAPAREPSRRVITPAAGAAVRSKVRGGPRITLARRSFGSEAFSGAHVGRMTESWGTSPMSADEYVRKYQKTLVARSRQQSTDNDYGKKFLALVVRNVIGPSGVTLNARAKDDDGTLDEVANRAIEKSWKLWGKGENCDVAGVLSFTEQCKLAMKTLAKDGEAIGVIATGEQAGPWGFAIQLIDPQRLDIDYCEELTNGEFIRFGIHYSAYGRPLRYFFREVEENSNTVPGGVSQRTQRMRSIDAANVINLFIPEMVEQKRGLPWMSTALFRMKMLGGMEDAALTAARVGAAKMTFLTTDDDFEEDTFGGEEEIPLDAEPGAMPLLPRGVNPVDSGVNYPSGEFAGFMKACLRGIGCGLDVSYNALANDLEGVNYSSIRHGLQDERDLWVALQKFFIEKWCDRIYQRWLEHSLLSQRIVIAPSGKALRAIAIDKYREVEWQPRRWTWIDPEKEVKAAGDSVDRKFTSRGDVVRERGDDPENVEAELAAEVARDDAANVRRITELQKLCKVANASDPELKLHWSHIATLSGAQTAPAPYLAATAAGTAAANKPEKPAAKPAE